MLTQLVSTHCWPKPHTGHLRTQQKFELNKLWNLLSQPYVYFHFKMMRVRANKTGLTLEGRWQIGFFFMKNQLNMTSEVFILQQQYHFFKPVSMRCVFFGTTVIKSKSLINWGISTFRIYRLSLSYSSANCLCISVSCERQRKREFGVTCPEIKTCHPPNPWFSKEMRERAKTAWSSGIAFHVNRSSGC